MDAAKEQGMYLKEILSHDLLPTSPLFDGDLPVHVIKSTYCRNWTWSGPHTMDTKLFFVHSGWGSNLLILELPSMPSSPKFFTLAQESGFCPLGAWLIHSNMSLKEGERMWRAASGIDIIGMDKDTPIPQQLDKFWASEENKQNPQLLVSKRNVIFIRNRFNFS